MKSTRNGHHIPFPWLSYIQALWYVGFKGVLTHKRELYGPGRPQAHQLQPHLPRLTARVTPTILRISLPSQWRVLGWHGEPLDQLFSWCAWATARIAPTIPRI